jgi:UDP-N-acetylmuramoyl-tripeptide--D-alanyl-D-alanine ligase
MNMSFWELDNVKAATGGSWLARPAANERVTPTGLSLDTRTLQNGQAFLALKGERTDGHEYLAGAAKAGASLLIVDREDAIKPLLATLHRSTSVLLVADTGKALLQLAGAYRKTLESTRVIAVGGSNGKTTTTRLIESVLSSVLRGTASKKSFNNAVGVPLTILAAKRTDQFLICEVGTNAPGEIAVLSAVLQPDIAVITSIGREHLEGLGSIEGVVAEEARLLDDLRAGGVAIITADSPELTRRVLGGPSETGKQSTRSIIRFGVSPEAELRISNVEVSAAGTHFAINERAMYSVPLLGAHNACNAAAAIAVAKRMGLSDEAIRAALATARGAEMRLQPIQKNGVQFLNDAYNANPESMLAAFDVFTSCTTGPGRGRRVLVLGEMLELGDATVASHREIGEAAVTRATADLIIFVGEHAKHAAEAAGQKAGGATIDADHGKGERATIVHIAATTDAAMREIASLLRAGDFVLLKGSRRVALERVIEHVATPTISETKPLTQGVTAA